MKSKLPERFPALALLATPLIFLFGGGGDSLTLKPLMAQSPAASAIQRRIQNEAIKSNGGAKPANKPAAKAKPRPAAKNPPAAEEAPAKEKPAGKAGKQEDGEEATTEEVKKEHPPLQIFTEPFYTYNRHEGPVTSILANDDGDLALTASKDASIQLWLTVDYSQFYYDDYDDFDNLSGVGNAYGNGADAKGTGGKGTGATGKGSGTGNVGGKGTTTGNRNATGNAGRPSTGFKTQTAQNPRKGSTAQGEEDDASPRSYGFMRRGNLNKSGVSKKAEEEETKDAQKRGNWSKKEKKIPSTLGKRLGILERLRDTGERRGSGFTDMFVSPFDDFLFTSDYDGNIRRWDLQTKKSQVYSYKKEKDSINTMWGVDFYPIGDWPFEYKGGSGGVISGSRNRVYQYGILAGANNNGWIYFWNSLTRKLYGSAHIHKGPVYDISFAPDASAVVTAGGDKSARVVAIPEMEVVSLLKGHKGAVLSASFSDDGSYILTSSEDKSACLWDSYSGELVCAFIGHTGPVTKATFITSGSSLMVMTCSADKTVRIWELPDDVSLLGTGEMGSDGEDGGKKEGIGWGEAGEEDFSFDEEETDESNDEDASDSEDDKPSKGKDSNAESDEEEIDLSDIDESDIPEQSIADAKRGYEIARFEIDSPASSAYLSPYYLFTGGVDGKVKVWDISGIATSETMANAAAEEAKAGQEGMGPPGPNGPIPGMDNLPPGINPPKKGN